MKNKKSKKGFTLIEAVVLLAIFAISVIAFYRIFTLATFHIIESKKRLAAIALANERMEHIRNITYDDIWPDNAPLPGDPDNNGLIDSDDVVTVNDVTYRILVNVRFIDDPHDDLGGSGDLLFDDYKRVQIYVLWGSGIDDGTVTPAQAKGSDYRTQRVDIISQFVPPGGLESETGNGLISINVLDSDANPIDDAGITIFHGSSPSVNYSDLTDPSGNLLYSTAPSDAYEITVEKSGYETIKSEIPFNGSTQLYEPTNPHQTVLQGVLTTMTVIMDPVSDFDVNVRDPFCQPISPGVEFDFDIVGGRVLGTDPNNDGAPVFVLDTSLTTDTSGDIEIYTDTDADGTIETDGSDEASTGQYTLTLNEPGFTLWKLEPGDDVSRNITIAESGAATCNFVVIDEAYDSALVQVVDSSSGDTAPIVDAAIRLQNVTLGYDISQISDKYGLAFFPDDANVPLVNGEEYDVRVSADGYYDKNTTVTITGLEQPIIDLSPLP